MQTSKRVVLITVYIDDYDIAWYRHADASLSILLA